MSQEATPAGSAPRPNDVLIVTILALVAALFDVVTAVAWLRDRDSLGDGPVFLAWATLLVGLGTALLAVTLFMGSRWARTLIATFMGFHIAAHAWAWIALGSDYAVAAMIDILIASVVLILLFSRESSAYLTGMKR